MSEKITGRHLERKAILYVRQSSAYQVHHNLESQKLQYAMQARLQALGWREIEGGFVNRCVKGQAAFLVGSIFVCTATPSLNRFPS